MGERERAALRVEYTSTTKRLREALLDALLPLFLGPGSWRETDLDTFLERALPTILGAQEAMAWLTDAYLSQRIADRFGETPRLVGVESAAAVRGVPPDQVYRRPFAQVWTELSHGMPLETAVKHGADRLENLALTDLQLTKTHTARAVLSADDRVTGYRRTPEGAETCALCLIASTQLYGKRELMPLHTGCDCGVEEVTGETGQVLDQDLLDQVHDAIHRDLGDEARGVDYRQLVLVHEHGELGPVLTVRHHKHTGHAQI
ncbi:hypothetical protein NE857_09200 [Nocardiopsis exhalans]|uniref:Phage protein n=1 Tax=Nocardiopsis exhalans TaxID=163604 RepID=A0ABY5DCK4_9ACTN|nr:hypothetical protein [Nocardiopsis exhalans]USY21757.1 hypothetical protein NE857_09200 [Nocardiopsis exhalans]